MPLHDTKCENCGSVEERFIPLKCLGYPMWCAKCHGTVQVVYLRAPLGFVQRDICYDSPIDGRPITSKMARTEDLRRNECVEWDPGMKQDFLRGQRDREAALDKMVDSTVDEFVATAPARKLEKLEQELHAGASVEVKRDSPATT